MKWIVLLLCVCPLIQAQEVKDPGYSKWRVNLSGGLGYLLGSTAEAKKAMKEYIVNTDVVDDYYSDHYLFTDKSGNNLFLVKNVNNQSNTGVRTDYNAWSIEVVRIQ